MLKFVIDFSAFWSRFWVPFGSSWGAFRVPKTDFFDVPICDRFWRLLGWILGAFWGAFWVLLGTFSDSKILLGTFWEPLGGIFGASEGLSEGKLREAKLS